MNYLSVSHSGLELNLNVHSLPGHIALSLVSQCVLGLEQGKQRFLPKSVIDVCRMVYQAKCSLIKVQLPIYGFQQMLKSQNIDLIFF